MPKQETYFEKTVDGLHIVVIKSYDTKFAREAFNVMDGTALAFLSESLTSDNKVELVADAAPREPEYFETLWERIEEGAREDWNAFSYFIVMSDTSPVYVSSDWPSAEAYANHFADTVIS